jgi:hypothetical protein
MRMKAGSLITFAIISVLTVQHVPARQASDCRATEPIKAEPPRDPDADRFGEGPWFINGDRTIWAWAGPTGWESSPTGIKVLWIRPEGKNLKIAGRRLDQTAAPLSVDVPNGYQRSFQPTRLVIQSPGCWEISATVGTSQLTFVTAVR